MKSYKLITLEIGLASAHGECAPEDGSRASISGMYGPLSGYYGELIDGGWVIDKSKPLDARPGLAVMSPMVDGRLADGAVDIFQGVDSFLGAALSSPEAFGGLAQMAVIAPECGAFDYVSPTAFAAWWRDKGARIGQRRGNRVIWEDGAIEEIA